MRWIKQTRRPTADIHAINDGVRQRRSHLDASVGVKSAMPNNLRTYRVHIRREPRLRHNPSMEVAIRAFRLTKRNLNVNTERIHAKIVARLVAPACPKVTKGILPTFFFNPPKPSPKPSSPSVHQTHTKKSPAKSRALTSRPPQKSSGSSPSSLSSYANPCFPPHDDTAPCAEPTDQ